MRVAIDVSIQETDYVTGVERVQRGLLEALAATADDVHYLLLSRRPVDLGLDLPERFTQAALVKDGSPYLWRERFVPQVLERERIDVFHSPVSATPILGKAKKIATIHELPWVERGARVEPSEKVPAGHRMWLYLNVRYATRIVCVSERTRAQVLELYPEAAAKTSVIHHGVDARFRRLDPLPPREPLLARLAIPDRPFALYVGTLRRKKNLRLLLRAFADLPAAARKRYGLVLAGVRGATFGDLEASLADPRLAGVVALPGYVNDEDLVALYNHAMCVVYPSLFEGFGLPPLEAMACGTPVIASGGGAIPEVVGDAAALFAPADAGALREAILRAFEDEAQRAAWIERGARRVAGFRWDVAAGKYLDLYRDVARIG
jgi:glycosyltransferase involved in cell wall biosynthesis